MRWVVLGYFLSVGFANAVLFAILFAAGGGPGEFDEVRPVFLFFWMVYASGLAICAIPFAVLRTICWRMGWDSEPAALLSGAGIGCCVAMVTAITASGIDLSFTLAMTSVFAAIGAAAGWVQWLTEASARQDTTTAMDPRVTPNGHGGGN